MATILEFRAQSREAPVGAARSTSRTAEVVLFPGVRYERWGEAAPQPAPRKGRRRDTLEVDE